MSKRKLSKADYAAMNRGALTRRIPPGGGPQQVGPIRNASPPNRKKGRH